MPTYDYLCDACSHQFEHFQSIKAEPLQKCPQCGEKIRRLIGGGGGILFKGSGFYQTDYRSKKYKESAKKETSCEKSSSSQAPKCSNCPHAPKETK